LTALVRCAITCCLVTRVFVAGALVAISAPVY